MKNIVIVGGGFSGVVSAINLVRLCHGPVHIFVVDPGDAPGRGVAYNSRDESHLLNVVARNMSALADQPNHFVEWLGTRSEYRDEPPAALREKFVPRMLYSDYLQGMALWYAGTVAPEKEMKLEFIREQAADIIPASECADVVLSGGKVLSAQKVILAMGNQPPAGLRLPGLDPASPKYIGDPWIDWQKLLPPPGRDLLLVGTGLTMADAFLSLEDFGWRGKIFAISRHGLLPLSHFKGVDYPDYLDESQTAAGLRKIFSLFKKHYREAVARNLNPAILVDKLRPRTQRIWQSFSVTEKQRFIRHLRTRWNVMRHRIAPEVHERLRHSIAAGRLEIIRGKLRRCEETPDVLEIEIEDCGVRRILEVGALINCTGPAEKYSASGLLRNLISRGLAAPDDIDMGIRTGPNYSIVDAANRPSENFFALGSLLKGSLWESTAVPELRSQAFRIAETIAAGFAGDERKAPLISEVTEDVLEYSI